MKHTGCLHFITLMNLLHLPTSVNCPQDIISHIQVVHRLQVKSMHSLIRVWFLNPFRLPSSQCEAYSQHLYKCQCCFVVDCILQILFSSYLIAETKGTTLLDRNELRGVEDLKIQCAKAHFAAISNDSVVYDVVDSYDKLMQVVME